MRAEKRKRYIGLILVVVLLLSVPAVYIRVLSASRHIGGKKISQLTNDAGTITDRYGTVLYDDSGCKHPELLGNLIGGSPMVSKSISDLYAKEMAPSGFNALQGLSSLDDRISHEVMTTLIPVKDQQKLQEAFGDYNGALFAYNYKSGEVYVILSKPSSFSADATDGAYTNRCLSSRYIPGSTMKIVAVILALDHDKDLAKFKATCTGTLELPTGDVVKCHGVHGEVDMVKGIGKSCNCYMAALIQQLDEKEAREVLEELGIYTDNEGEASYVDRLRRVTSTTRFKSAHTFQDVWALIGQGDSAVNMVDMAMIAGSVVNNGKAAQPYLVEGIYEVDTEKQTYSAKSGKDVTLINFATARRVEDVWSKAVEAHYSSRINAPISHAKTGTAQLGDGSTNRMLMGVMEEYDTAFYLVVEGLPSGDNLIFDIANKLADILPNHVN